LSSLFLNKFTFYCYLIDFIDIVIKIKGVKKSLAGRVKKEIVGAIGVRSLHLTFYLLVFIEAFVVAFYGAAVADKVRLCLQSYGEGRQSQMWLWPFLGESTKC